VQQQALREQTGGMFVVSECHVQYLRAARLDDELVVTARLEETGRASLALTQQAYLQTAPGQRGALLCQARIRIGWVDAQRLRPPAFLHRSSND
jgi:acyl-CoA thioester hydrolase